MDELRDERDAFSATEQTTVAMVIFKIRRETFPDEGFSVMRLRMTLTLLVNVEQLICVAFDKAFVSFITELSLSFKELKAA